jgi:uncharacterized protein YodC (DUF2158 family)
MTYNINIKSVGHSADKELVILRKESETVTHQGVLKNTGDELTVVGWMNCDIVVEERNKAVETVEEPMSNGDPTINNERRISVDPITGQETSAAFTVTSGVGSYYMTTGSASKPTPVFQKGDVVQLRSGGPPLTVTYCNGIGLETVVAWTLTNGDYRNNTYPPECLQTYKPELDPTNSWNYR